MVLETRSYKRRKEKEGGGGGGGIKECLQVLSLACSKNSTLRNLGKATTSNTFTYKHKNNQYCRFYVLLQYQVLTVKLI